MSGRPTSCPSPRTSPGRAPPAMSSFPPKHAGFQEIPWRFPRSRTDRPIGTRRTSRPPSPNLGRRRRRGTPGHPRDLNSTERLLSRRFLCAQSLPEVAVSRGGRKTFPAEPLHSGPARTYTRCPLRSPLRPGSVKSAESAEACKMIAGGKPNGRNGDRSLPSGEGLSDFDRHDQPKRDRSRAVSRRAIKWTRTFGCQGTVGQRRCWETSAPPEPHRHRTARNYRTTGPAVGRSGTGPRKLKLDRPRSCGSPTSMKATLSTSWLMIEPIAVRITS